MKAKIKTAIILLIFTLYTLGPIALGTGIYLDNDIVVWSGAGAFALGSILMLGVAINSFGVIEDLITRKAKRKANKEKIKHTKNAIKVAKREEKYPVE